MRQLSAEKNFGFCCARLSCTERRGNLTLDSMYSPLTMLHCSHITCEDGIHQDNTSRAKNTPSLASCKIKNEVSCKTQEAKRCKLKVYAIHNRPMSAPRTHNASIHLAFFCERPSQKPQSNEQKVTKSDNRQFNQK